MKEVNAFVAAALMIGGGYSLPVRPDTPERPHKPYFIARTGWWVCANGKCKLRARTIQEMHALIGMEHTTERGRLTQTLKCPTSVPEIRAAQETP